VRTSWYFSKKTCLLQLVSRLARSWLETLEMIGLPRRLRTRQPAATGGLSRHRSAIWHYPTPCLYGNPSFTKRYSHVRKFRSRSTSAIIHGALDGPLSVMPGRWLARASIIVPERALVRLCDIGARTSFGSQACLRPIEVRKDLRSHIDRAKSTQSIHDLEHTTLLSANQKGFQTTCVLLASWMG
jgi:hypothetical protein